MYLGCICLILETEKCKKKNLRTATTYVSGYYISYVFNQRNTLYTNTSNLTTVYLRLLLVKQRSGWWRHRISADRAQCDTS